MYVINIQPVSVNKYSHVWCGFFVFLYIMNVENLI